MELKKGKSKKVLIHTCCSVCAASLVEELIKKGFEPIIFIYSPNVQPKEEYEKRRNSTRKLAEIYGLELIEEEYEPEKWFQAVKGYEQEPEGGKRCPICFNFLLQKTAQRADKENIPYYTTSLLTSPYKDKGVIKRLASKISFQSKFFPLEGLDFQENWRKTRILANKYNFYHQKYCGCLFSL